MEDPTSQLDAHGERVAAQISALATQVTTARSNGGIQAELATLFPPPMHSDDTQWEASLSALIGHQPGACEQVVHTLQHAARQVGVVRIGTNEVGFDGTDVAWDDVVEVRTTRVGDVVTEAALDQEIRHLGDHLPAAPERRWVLDRAGELLAAMSLATLGAEIDQGAGVRDGSNGAIEERQVVTEVVYRDGSATTQQLVAGLFTATYLAQLPAADEALRTQATQRGIPIVATAPTGDDEQQPLQRVEEVRSRFTRIAGRVGGSSAGDGYETGEHHRTADTSVEDDAPGGADAARLLLSTDIAGAALRLAHSAGAAILQVAAGADPNTQTKDDASPVTVADIRAETLIVAGLASLTPRVPIVAEEQVAAGQVPDVSAGLFWLVDPLDGTKEFLSGNGEYTVNIALIADGEPILGVVYLPALDTAYVGGPNGAVVHNSAGEQPLTVRAVGSEGFDVLVSRSHLDPDTEEWLAEVPVHDRVSAGSSLKFCRIAEARADLYPRFGRTMEWDTGAGDAVVRAAGGMVRRSDGGDLVYGKPGFENPAFIAYGATPPPVYAG